MPPLVTDIDLSMDDKFLYVACWGTGEMRQYDVTEPRKPKLAGSVHVGGIVRRTPHPNGKAYAGGPQMVEISRDGKRVYWTNSLYSTWDNQFYPEGIPGAEVMVNANPKGGLELAKEYWVSFPTATGRIRSGSMAGTVRRIRSAIRRFEFERSGLDTCLAVAGRRRERPLPRSKSGNGVAARRFGWIDGQEFACLVGRAWAAGGRSSARDAPGASSLRAVDGTRRMAAPDTVGASLLVIGFGVFRLVDQRHPRALARIRPTQLGLWSFAVAIATARD